MIILYTKTTIVFDIIYVNIFFPFSNCNIKLSYFVVVVAMFACLKRLTSFNIEQSKLSAIMLDRVNDQRIT